MRLSKSLWWVDRPWRRKRGRGLILAIADTLACDHTKGTPYFIESINSKRGFYAGPCPNLVSYLLGWCEPKDTDYVLMGEHCRRKWVNLYTAWDCIIWLNIIFLPVPVESFMWLQMQIPRSPGDTREGDEIQERMSNTAESSSWLWLYIFMV